MPAVERLLKTTTNVCSSVSRSPIFFAADPPSPAERSAPSAASDASANNMDSMSQPQPPQKFTSLAVECLRCRSKTRICCPVGPASGCSGRPALLRWCSRSNCPKRQHSDGCGCCRKYSRSWTFCGRSRHADRRAQKGICICSPTYCRSSFTFAQIRLARVIFSFIHLLKHIIYSRTIFSFMFIFYCIGFELDLDLIPLFDV